MMISYILAVTTETTHIRKRAATQMQRMSCSAVEFRANVWGSGQAQGQRIRQQATSVQHEGIPPSQMGELSERQHTRRSPSSQHICCGAKVAHLSVVMRRRPLTLSMICRYLLVSSDCGNEEHDLRLSWSAWP